MNTSELLLIDFSSLAVPIWKMSGAEPDPNHASTQMVARVRALASDHAHCAICIDTGKSFRHELDPTYKSNRPERDEPMHHQMTLALEQLRADGFPVWGAKGFEADDVVASSVKRALDIEDTTVLVASSDKDLLALINHRVRAKSLTNGSIYDEEAVMAKLGVKPSQVTDYLCLTGDASDAIVGAKGIGGVRASAILKRYGTLEQTYQAMDKGATPDITPAQRTALQEFRARWPTVRALIALRTDVDIAFEEIASERSPHVPEMASEGESADSVQAFFDASPEPAKAPCRCSDAAWAPDCPQHGRSPERELPPAAATDALKAATATVAARIAQPSAPLDVTHLAERNAPNAPRTELAPVADFTMQLEPRTMPEAITLAKHMFESRLFSAYGTPQAVLATVLAGRELGMPAMASLRNFHIIENRPQLSADSLAALVLASGKAKYFKVTKRSPTAAAFKTLRLGDDEEPFELVYTIEEAKQAWKKDQKAWDASGWGKNPADMLIARAKSKLARLVYPDVVGGLYAVEEME